MLCVFVCCLVSLQRPEYRLSQSPRLVRKQSVSSFNFTSKASPSTFCVLVHVLSPCHSRSRVVATVVFVLLLRDSLSRGFVLLATELSVSYSGLSRAVALSLQDSSSRDVLVVHIELCVCGSRVEVAFCCRWYNLRRRVSCKVLLSYCRCAVYVRSLCACQSLKLS